MDRANKYHSHEGCQYRFAIRRVQELFGVKPDSACPVCKDKTLVKMAVPKNNPSGRSIETTISFLAR